MQPAGRPLVAEPLGSLALVYMGTGTGAIAIDELNGGVVGHLGVAPGYWA